MPKSNVARRIEAVINGAVNVGGEPNVAEAWVQVLGLEAIEVSSRDRAVARRLAFLQEQVHALRAELAARGVDSETYTRQLDSVDQAFALRILGRQWGDVRNQLTPEVRSVVAVLRELLPDETPSTEDLENLSTLLDELDDWIRESELPDTVKRFLHAQLDFIRSAIDEFAYRGAPAFQDASERAARAWVQNSQDIAPYATTPQVLAVRKLWPTIAKWGNRIVLIGNLASLILVDGPVMWEALQGAIPTVGEGELPETPLLLAPPAREPTDATAVIPGGGEVAS
jgi:hypothetical protein